MNIAQPQHGFSKKLMVLSILAAIGPALAEEGGDIAQYTKPESSVSVGVGGVSGDSQATNPRSKRAPHGATEV